MHFLDANVHFRRWECAFSGHECAFSEANVHFCKNDRTTLATCWIHDNFSRKVRSQANRKNLARLRMCIFMNNVHFNVQICEFMCIFSFLCISMCRFVHLCAFFHFCACQCADLCIYLCAFLTTECADSLEGRPARDITSKRASRRLKFRNTKKHFHFSQSFEECNSLAWSSPGLTRLSHFISFQTESWLSER